MAGTATSLMTCFWYQPGSVGWRPPRASVWSAFGGAGTSWRVRLRGLQARRARQRHSDRAQTPRGADKFEKGGRTKKEQRSMAFDADLRHTCATHSTTRAHEAARLAGRQSSSATQPLGLVVEVVGPAGRSELVGGVGGVGAAADSRTVHLGRAQDPGHSWAVLSCAPPRGSSRGKEAPIRPVGSSNKAGSMPSCLPGWREPCAGAGRRLHHVAKQHRDGRQGA